MQRKLVIVALIVVGIGVIAAGGYSTSAIAHVDAFDREIGVTSAGKVISGERIEMEIDTPVRVSSALEGADSYASLVRRVIAHGAVCTSTSGYINAGQDAMAAGELGEITPTLNRFAETACEQGDLHIDISRVWKGQELPDWTYQGILVLAARDGAMIAVQGDPDHNVDRGGSAGLTNVKSSDVSAWAATHIRPHLSGPAATVDCGTGDVSTYSDSAIDCLVTEASGATHPIRVTFHDAGGPTSRMELESGAGPVTFG